MGQNSSSKRAVDVKNFSYAYPNQQLYYGREALTNVTFNLPRGARCLLIGHNGAGKSALLSCLVGMYQHEVEQIKVLGHGTTYQTLGASGVGYLGWASARKLNSPRKRAPYEANIRVRDLCRELQDRFSDRRDTLYKILEINPDWRMNCVSDGQARRIQIMLGLLRPFKILLLDEMTVDLDVVARKAFLEYVRADATKRKATVVYATHVFDGMEEWPTHVLMLDHGEVARCCTIDAVKREKSFKSMHQFAFDFLERQREKRIAEAEKKEQAEKEQKEALIKERAASLPQDTAIPRRSSSAASDASAKPRSSSLGSEASVNSMDTVSTSVKKFAWGGRPEPLDTTFTIA